MIPDAIIFEKPKLIQYVERLKLNQKRTHRSQIPDKESELCMFSLI